MWLFQDWSAFWGPTMSWHPLYPHLLIKQEDSSKPPAGEVCLGLFTSSGHIMWSHQCSPIYSGAKIIIGPRKPRVCGLCVGQHRVPRALATHPPSEVKSGEDGHQLELSLLWLNEQAQPSEEDGKHWFLPDLCSFIHMPCLSLRNECTGFSWSTLPLLSKVKYFRAFRLWA